MPHLRDSLWSLVSARLDRIESGLTLVLEGLDCSDGQLGLVDGLARDAIGAPVLILLAVEGDSLLPARTLAAGQFVQRVGDALAGAVPEAGFRPGTSGRLLVVGTDASASLLDKVRRLPVDCLQACSLEPFRVAGTERFAVRWLGGESAGSGAAAAPAAIAAAAAVTPAAVEFVVPAPREELWQMLRSICERIDGGVVLHGDRFSRRVTWNGHQLGELRTAGDALVGRSATGVTLDLRSPRDVRRFGDQLLRAFAAVAGLDVARPSSPVRDDPTSSDDRFAATRHAAPGRGPSAGGRPNGPPVVESLRSSLAAARLSPEEYSALDGPVASTGSVVEGTVAEDRKQTSPSAPPSVDRD